MNFLGNIIWLLFGGFFTALGYFVGGFLLCLTIIGIPFGLQCFKLGILMLWKNTAGRPASSTSALYPMSACTFQEEECHEGN